jgi:RNA polymerase sigma-70 factor (sigma-E family)
MEFEQFVRERFTPLVRFAWVICADRALAEDLVQEVLIRVHRHWPRIERLDSPEAYVRKALVNEYLSWRRKWARLIPHADVPDFATSRVDHAEQHADQDQLGHDLAALPPRQRTVLVLRYYVGLDDAEIAAVLGCRRATVRGYAARGLAALRIELTAQAMRSSNAH